MRQSKGIEAEILQFNGRSSQIDAYIKICQFVRVESESQSFQRLAFRTYFSAE